MTNNQDARPFVDLQRDAEEFRAKFDEDIAECINFLDSKITALICDPDSLSSSARSVKQNTLVEFSKSKYDIFINIKSLMNKKEREWNEYISEMKKLFIENVEIFLAGTKLEVKLPQSEFESSPGPRKSPGNRKSISMTSSLYPILSNITKNIPGLGSPLQAKEASKVEEKVQFNRGNRSSTKLDKPSSVFAAYKDSTEESSESEAETDRSIQTSIKGRLSATAFKLANSSFQDQHYDNVMDTDETGLELNTSKSGSRKSRKSGQLNNSGLDNSLLNRSRRSSSRIELNAGTSPALPEEIVPIAQSKSPAASRSRSVSTRRGKQSTQTTKLVNETPQKYGETEINEDTSVTKANVRNQRSMKSLGKQSKQPADVSKSTSSSEEMDDTKTGETSVKPVKGRKGKQGAKTKANNSSEKENIEETTKDVIVPKTSVEPVPIKTRRGRSAAADTENSVSVEDVPVKKSVRGRKSFKAVTESHTSVPSYSKSYLTSSEEYVEPKQDIFTPATRPVKAVGRRKTMLPNLEDMPEPEQLSGNTTRARSKRKTICDFAELNTATSSKRLKSASGKSVLSVQAEDAAEDNLLEGDDNYSDWMALKSLDGKIPTNPGVYEVKVWRAKKPAFIGFSESLRQKFTLYKLRQNSGHKHLDKFVDRNYDDIQIRFETVSSVDLAKQEVKKRISSFTAQYKTTPAYN